MRDVKKESYRLSLRNYGLSLCSKHLSRGTYHLSLCGNHLSQGTYHLSLRNSIDKKES